MDLVTLKSKQGRWIMVSTILASAMAFIDMTGLNVVLPSLQKSLNASAPELFWILNGYLLMVASLILIGGALGDKLGRKRIFITGIAIFIIGSCLCGLSVNTIGLISFRIIQGVGGALMIPGSLSLISSAIVAEERGKAIGIWSAFSTVCTMGGPMLAGALADAGLWRYFFFINVPIGIVAILMLYFKVNEIREESRKSIDFLGAITVASGLILLTFGFLRIPSIGFYNLSTYLTLSGGVLFLAFFILIERRCDYPMMPLGLFKNKIFSGANLLTFFLYAGLAAGSLFLSLNLVQMQGYSQFESGLTFLPFTILMVLIAGYIGGLADKYGARWFLIAGPVIAGIGQLLLSFVGQTSGPAAYFSTFFPGILILGFGMSVIVAPLTATVMGSVDNHFSGVASGINNAMTSISGVLANAIFGAIAILFFYSALQKNLSLETWAADKSVRTAILSQAGNLGDAKVPALLRHRSREVVKIYHECFIMAYQQIMRISACLSIIAALVTFIFIRKKSTSIKIQAQKDDVIPCCTARTQWPTKAAELVG